MGSVIVYIVGLQFGRLRGRVCAGKHCCSGTDKNADAGSDVDRGAGSAPDRHAGAYNGSGSDRYAGSDGNSDSNADAKAIGYIGDGGGYFTAHPNSRV